MAELLTARREVAAGGGPFALPELTVGIFLTDQAEHRIATGSDRRERIPLTRHQGWIMPAGSDGICEFETALDLLTLQVPGELLRDAGFEDGRSIRPVIGDLDPLLLSMALNAESFGTGDRLYRDTMHRAVAAQLVQVLAPPRDETAAVEDVRLRRALDHIHDRLDTDLGLDGMADTAAMSVSRFARAFKAATGLSPLQYVIAARLDRASVLLRTTRLTVAEIAYRVGYNDLSRFGRHFKRRFGTTPAALRDG